MEGDEGRELGTGQLFCKFLCFRVRALPQQCSGLGRAGPEKAWYLDRWV